MRTAIVIFLALVAFAAADAQLTKKNKERKTPFIEIVDCIRCGEYVIYLPYPKYPGYVGYGPHVFNGTVGVQVLIDETGKIEKATGISGHPYFRPILEEESMKATFKPKVVAGTAVKNVGVILYYVASKKTTEIVERILPVVNGAATFLPAPIYPEDLKKSCAHGRVEIEIMTSSAGLVIKTKEKSGNPLLYDAAMSAAKQAKFLNDPIIQMRGVLIYNFKTPADCPVS